MNYIEFNDYKCVLSSFNKYTNFSEGQMFGNASCQIVASDLTGLQEVGVAGVTSIKIFHGEEVIYSLENIHARISSINETLVDDHMDIMVGLEF